MTAKIHLVDNLGLQTCNTGRAANHGLYSTSPVTVTCRECLEVRRYRLQKIITRNMKEVREIWELLNKG